MALTSISHGAETQVASAVQHHALNYRPVPGPAYWECVAEVLAGERNERPDVQLIDIAYWSRASQGAISRFERRESQPRDLDRLVVAYAKVLDLDPVQVMQSALDNWAAGGGAELPTSPFDLLPPGGEIEKRARAAAPRKSTPGRRGSGGAGRRRDAG